MHEALFPVEASKSRTTSKLIRQRGLEITAHLVDDGLSYATIEAYVVLPNIVARNGQFWSQFFVVGYYLISGEIWPWLRDGGIEGGQGADESPRKTNETWM